jgi:glycerol-3-phosphate dehydrogenase
MSHQAARLDLVVVGGGITGLGVARLAARNGYTCALVERGDLSAGASSASSHMLHGGLRYLAHGRFALVREALEERVAVSRMAPALAKPARFLVPLYRGDRVPPWKLRAGLMLYDRLAGRAAFSAHAMARPAEAERLEPGLEIEGLRAAGLYTDVVMDDARLAIAVAEDAAAHGAAIHTYREVVGARPLEGGGVELEAADRLDGGGVQTLQARVVVNATGPWTDETRTRLFRSLRPGAPDPTPLLRPSRGIHLVYPRLTERHGLLVVAREDGRAFFLVPFGAHALVGTTEVEVTSPPDETTLKPTVDEVRYLRRELDRVLPGTGARPPLAVMAGVRPLLRSEEGVGEASREHRVVDEDGVVTIAGGKYTTFRVMARDTLTLVARRLGHEGRALHDSTDLLPAPPPPEASLEHQVEHAVTRSFARRLEDVVRRRGHWWLESDRGRVAASRIANVMARLLGWSPERMRAEFQGYDASLWEEQTLLQRAREVS